MSSRKTSRSSSRSRPRAAVKSDHNDTTHGSSGPSAVERAPKRKRTRRPNLYDAVAGRVNTSSFITATSQSQAPALPEHVLFRSALAPELTVERDTDLDSVYWISDRLDPAERLPDSDLLKAVHEYAADFYASAVPGRGQADFESLDGTALLAVGILVEEACRRALGETGDFAFLERSHGDYEASIGTEELQRGHE